MLYLVSNLNSDIDDLEEEEIYDDIRIPLRINALWDPQLFISLQTIV